MLSTSTFSTRAGAVSTSRKLRTCFFLLLALFFAQGIQAQEIRGPLTITDPVGGVLRPATSTIKLGENSSRLTLTGFTGTVIAYQYDTGEGFVTVEGGGEQLLLRGLKKTSRIRAVVQAPNGRVVTSTIATVVVVDASSNANPRAQLENRQSSFVHELVLKWSPLATQDPIASTILLGLEYRLSPKYGVEASYGAQFSDLRLTTLGLIDRRHDYKYQKFKLEMRRYLEPRTKNPNQETYVGLQAFAIPQRYTRYGDNFYRDGRYVTYDRALVEKDIIGLTFKVGSQWHLAKHWQLEVGGGFGARYVDVRYDMSRQRKVNEAGKSQSNIFNQIESPGTRVNLDAELVFKVGYAILGGSK